MTSALPATSRTPLDAQPTAAAAATATLSSATTSSPTGAVPAQHPAKSYASATKTATPQSAAGASAPTHNAKPAAPDASMNGPAAQGGSQPAQNTNNSNGSMNGADHGRKPSVVINASGATGQFPNGGPVQNGNTRPAISFGSMNAPGAESHVNAPFHQQNASLHAASNNPRISSPAHSPSPIPQPAASGGRPPSSIAAGPVNGQLSFGSINADTEMMRGQMPPAGNMSNLPLHERRPSSHSMHSEASNQGVNMGRPNFQPPAGRGRGFPPQPPFMGSPAQSYRPMPNQPGRPQFQPQPPGSPYRGARASPVPVHPQPHMAPGHMGPNPYNNYQQHLNPQGQQMYGSMPGFDPSTGYYPPYYYQGGYGQPPPQSPRPQYPSPFAGQAGMQPPYHPPGTPGMARTPSQASERPASSLGHPQTPAQNFAVPSQTPVPGQQQGPSGNFVRPVKKSAILIRDPNSGEAVDFSKPTASNASASASASSQAQPQTPVIVSTPNAPTPPPRAPSSQNNRSDSKKSAEEIKKSIQEQVKRRKEEDEKAQQQREQADSDAAREKEEAVKKAAAEAEEAAAKAAADKKAEEEAAAAKKEADDAEEKKRKEDEEFERMIAEMEAQEKEEEERERQFAEKKAKEKEAQKAQEAERAAKADEELKRQEREAEERELKREREREAGETSDKSAFAELKKPTLGPGASASASGAETPTSEDAADSSTDAPAAAAATSAPLRAGQKPRPAQLKLETNKPVERAEPTPGMQALKSSRFLEIREEALYPDGYKSPNPALNQAGARKGRAYDKDFLLQFQSVFKEKPSVDWDQKVRDTLGPSDEPSSARPGSARTPSGAMNPRSASGRPANPMAFGGAMGNFGGAVGGRTIPAGTTSEQRFAASQMVGGSPVGRPGGPGMVRAPSNLGPGGMSRTGSGFQMGPMGPNSTRQPSTRGPGGGRGDSKRAKSKREEADMSNKMPLTAGMQITPLEKSTTGWKPTSIGQPPSAAVGPDPSGNMAPDLVQRKVKAALNKMTPEKFDKISDDILAIAAQSKNESDGRTLRQVIQLTFEKACDEAHWAGMYAKFCHKMLTSMSSDIRDDTIRDKNDQPVVGGALFRKYLLNRCQEEFERGWQANLPEKPEGDTQEAALLSDEYYIAAAAKRKGLGLIQFIGQLYKLRMLTLRIMHECVMRLLNFEGDPDEAAVENLTTLLKAVGFTMENDTSGKGLMDTYFQRIQEVLLNNEALPSRPRFMIMDLVDLRKAGWKGKDDAKGPKTITQIHQEAEAAKAREEAERQKGPRGGGGGRPAAGRGDARNFSGNMPPPADFQSTVRMDDLRKLQGRANSRPTSGSLGPGGGLGPSMLGARGGSRRGAGGLGPGSSGTSRTNTPPVDAKKEEPATAQNAFSALAGLDASGDQPDDTQSQSEAASPPAARNRSKSPLADES